MHCPSFIRLVESRQEALFIAELLHSVTHDETLFRKATALINEARNKGVFEGVVFNPPTYLQEFKEVESNLS